MKILKYLKINRKIIDSNLKNISIRLFEQRWKSINLNIHKKVKNVSIYTNWVDHTILSLNKSHNEFEEKLGGLIKTEDISEYSNKVKEIQFDDEKTILSTCKNLVLNNDHNDRYDNYSYDIEVNNLKNQSAEYNNSNFSIINPEEYNIKLTSFANTFKLLNIGSSKLKAFKYFIINSLYNPKISDKNYENLQKFVEFEIKKLETNYFQIHSISESIFKISSLELKNGVIDVIHNANFDIRKLLVSNYFLLNINHKKIENKIDINFALNSNNNYMKISSIYCEYMAIYYQGMISIDTLQANKFFSEVKCRNSDFIIKCLEIQKCFFLNLYNPKNLELFFNKIDKNSSIYIIIKNQENEINEKNDKTDKTKNENNNVNKYNTTNDIKIMVDENLKNNVELKLSVILNSIFNENDFKIIKNKYKNLNFIEQNILEADFNYNINVNNIRTSDDFNTEISNKCTILNKMTNGNKTSKTFGKFENNGETNSDDKSFCDVNNSFDDKNNSKDVINVIFDMSSITYDKDYNFDNDFLKLSKIKLVFMKYFHYKMNSIKIKRETNNSNTNVSTNIVRNL